jgi:excisionase family DNA binding protein
MTKPSRSAPVTSGLSLLTPAETGERIGASEMHVYRLIADGELRAVDIAQRGSKRSKTRIRSDDIDQYIEARTRHTGTPSPAA